MRGLILALAFAACPALAHAQTPEITPALFAVRDADSTLYLYGTVHVLPPGAPWANERVRAAIAESDEVWTETDSSEQSARRFANDLLTAMMTPAATPLSRRLPAEHRGTLRYVAKQFQADLDRLDPWEAALLLMSWTSEAGGRSALAGVDNQVVAAANAQGKRLRWLEELNVAEFAALSDETQLQFLLFVLDGLTTQNADVVALEEMWARGDLEGLHESQLLEMSSAYPALYAWIAVARNNAWIEVIVQELQGAGVDFIAVGAGHLLGEDGLVEQLRARGYEVERL